MFRKHIIHSILIILGTILVSNCRIRKKDSHVSTTSDRLKEFLYEIEGELKLKDSKYKRHFYDLVRV